MDIISLNILLEYLYKKFMVTFILCLMGAVIRETMNTTKLSKINAKRMLASVILVSALMCALIDYVEIPFSIYAIVCIVAGIWAQTIGRLIMHTKFMVKLLGKIAGSMKEPIVKGISDTIDELESEDNQDENKTDSTKENDTNESDDK